ncbi:MAG: glycosyltransferase family 2 protein [Thermoguttaceae bacterium]
MRSWAPAPRAAGSVPEVDIGLVYTYERDLMPRLLSTLAASGRGVRMRLILVDNHSADGADSWRGYLPDTLVLTNSRRLGYAANLNRVLRASAAPYVLLLNTDMFFDPRQQCVARMVRFMDRHPACGIATCGIYHEDGRTAYPARRFQTPAVVLARRLGLGGLCCRTLDAYLYRRLPAHETWQCEWVSGCFMMIRREAFLDVGYFDEGFVKYFEDVDICYRMARSGWQVLYHGAVHCYHLERRASRRLWTAEAWRHLRSYLRWHWKWGLSYRGDLPRPGPAVPAPCDPRRAA